MAAFNEGVRSAHPSVLLPQLVQKQTDLLQIVMPSGTVEKSLADVDKVIVVGGGKVAICSQFAHLF